MNEIILNEIIEQFKRFEKAKVLNPKYRKALENLIAVPLLFVVTLIIFPIEVVFSLIAATKLVLADVFKLDNVPIEVVFSVLLVSTSFIPCSIWFKSEALIGVSSSGKFFHFFGT